ncbi:unnamed protein product [Trichobilharzia szidati]|nr:unnamed protein product [Trichobilharzia szidati]
MVSQRTKLNLILLISLCIVNIEESESGEYQFGFTLDESGIITVDFGAVQFSFYDNYTVAVNSTGCVWMVDMSGPLIDEEETKKGTRNGSL